MNIGGARKASRVLGKGRRLVSACPGKKRCGLAVLTLAEFEGQPAARFQERQRIAHETLMDGDTIGSAIEGFAWLVVEKMGAVAFETLGGDIGRIADDQIDLALEITPGKATEEVGPG